MLSLEGKQLGNYDVIKQIRAGGMGAVYEGRQKTAFGRRVAIKVILNDYASDRDMRRRFAREAQTIARLQHPHILPLIEFGDEQGILYLVMPFIEGGTLTSYLRHRLPNLTEAASIYQQLLDAVEFAHDEGLIHRDIKSSNIMLEKRRNGPPHIYLGDFGLVRLIRIRTCNILQVGKPIPLDQVPGTPHYMAPEQTRGIITPQTDIYALGVILFQLLTGFLPYNDPDDIKVIKMHLHDPIPSPSEYDASIPVELSEVVNNAMAKNPDNRYQNVSELRSAFQAAVSGRKRRKTLSKTSTTSNNSHSNERPDTLFVRDNPASLTSDISLPAPPPPTHQSNNGEHTLKLQPQIQEGTSQHSLKFNVEPGPPHHEPGMIKHAFFASSTVPFTNEANQQHLVLPATPENTTTLSRHKQRQQSRIPSLCRLFLSRRLFLGIGIGLVMVTLSLALLQAFHINPLSSFSASRISLHASDQALITVSGSPINVKDSFLLTASTQYTTPDTTKYVIPASLHQDSATSGGTTSTTGSTTTGGSVAHGQLFVTNNGVQNYTIKRGQTFWTNNGTEIRADETTTIPYSLIGRQSSKFISASAIKPGTQGNIPAHSVNMLISDDIFIQNLTPFTGGTDTHTARTATQNDIDLLTNNLIDKLKAQIAQRLKSQISTDERQISDPKYTISSQSSAQPGNVADSIQVTVSIRASQLVYKPSDIQQSGKILLAKQVTHSCGSQCQQKGSLEISIPKITQDDTTTAIMNVTISGTWSRQFSTRQIQQWKDTIKGTTPNEAENYLRRQSHIQTVKINLPSGSTKLPVTTDRIQITIT